MRFLSQHTQLGPIRCFTMSLNLLNDKFGKIDSLIIKRFTAPRIPNKLINRLAHLLLLDPNNKGKLTKFSV